MKRTRILTLFVILTLLLAMTACSGSGRAAGTGDNKGIDFSVLGNEATLNYDTENPVVAMQIDGYGAVVVELYPDVAPNTVNNFIHLVKTGFYDNNTFHRLYRGFVLQGGDPTGSGSGGPGYAIRGEFSANGVKNDLKHEKGILSMARSINNDTAGSQFFIMLGDADWLDGEYAAFGKVIDGMELVEKIEAEEKTSGDILIEKLRITKMLVDTKNVDYPSPETMAK